MSSSRLQKLVDIYGPEPSESGDAQSETMERKERVRVALINMKMSVSDGLPCFVIAETLAIGSAGAAYNKAMLLANHITHVLILCGNNVKPAYPKDFAYKRISFEDRADAAELFDNIILDECLQYIRSILDPKTPPGDVTTGQAGLTCVTDVITAASACGVSSVSVCNAADVSVKSIRPRLLVHCYQGKSRSCAVVCAYLMFCLGFSLEEALGCIRVARPQVDINPGFMSVLLKRARLFNNDKRPA